MIWQDPGIRRLAWRRAGHRDLADDALQETFYAVAQVRHPERIENLRAFFCTALSHEISRQRGQLRSIPAEDPEIMAGPRGPGVPPCGAASPRPIDEAVVGRLIAQDWLTQFRGRREQLRAAVAERSGNPGRYRDVIVAVAEEILRDAGDGEVSWADSNGALRAAYPEWLDEPGCAPNTCHQRYSRARRDVRALLRTIVRREELGP